MAVTTKQYLKEVKRRDKEARRVFEQSKHAIQTIAELRTTKPETTVPFGDQIMSMNWRMLAESQATCRRELGYIDPEQALLVFSQYYVNKLVED